jgi:hypothetical protein
LGIDVTDYFKTWTPERVRGMALGQLVANGEIVGKFVETDARRRLVSIAVPEWGAQYRRQVVARLLTFTVDREPGAVVIRVGVAKGPKGTQHGLWIELGTATIPPRGSKPGRPGYPAHPFLRPAVFENQRQILALLAGK